MPGFKEDRDVFDNGGTKAKKLEKVNTGNGALAVNLSKVFLYMFIGLAITAAVAFGVGYLVASNFTEDSISTSNIYLGLLIGSAIAMIILMLIINFITLRGKHSIIVPGILYTIAVGVLLSMFTIFIDWRILGAAFGITSGVFLLMTLISFVSRGSMSGLAVAAMGLIMGSLILALVNFFIGSSTLYWIVSFAIFAAIMFIAMYDIYNVKNICQRGEMNNNIALYCAFVMYVDFINIFIRIVYFLALIAGKKN